MPAPRFPSPTVHPPRSYVKSTREVKSGQAVARIENAIHKAFPSNASRYQTVAVFMFHWSNDDMQVTGFEDELAHTLKEQFGFTVERCVIDAFPSKGNVAFNFSRKLHEFVYQYDGEDSLLLYVYSGHATVGTGFEYLLFGDMAMPPRGEPFFDLSTGKLMPPLKGPCIDWSGARFMPTAGEGRQIFLFNTSSAPTSAMTAVNSDRGEYIFINLPAISDRQGCSATFFVDLLRQYHSSKWTLANYHARLMDEISTNGNIGDALPVYIAALGDTTSAILSPMSTATTVQMEIQSDVQDLERLSRGKVLVSLALEGAASRPKVEQFAEYLRSHLPMEKLDIQVEAGFNAGFEVGSQLLLLTLPVVVWDCLEETKAINFVAYVQSSNVRLRESMSLVDRTITRA